MNKREFLAKLEKALAQLNREERKRELDYYEEMINDRIEEGMSEEEAVHRMGTVQGVAAKILSEAAPEQMKKKRKVGVLGWIGIALAAIVLITAALVILFAVDRVEDSGMIPDLEDMIEERLELEGGWIFGGDASFAANEVSAIDIGWAGGNVSILESEGREFAVKCNDNDALEYQLKDGTLYVETVENYDGKSDLKVYVPEDVMQLEYLNIVTAGGDVYADGEYFGSIEITTAGGDVRLNPEDAANVSVTVAGADVIMELDEDDAFVMNYAVDGGNVSVGFDRSFINESGNGESASYDHSLGRANCLNLNISVAGGDIKLLDD